jgi:trimeric autotransporter adhesin
MSMLRRGARWSGLLVGATLAVAGASCGGGGDGPTGTGGGGGPTVTRIDLSPGSASVIAGQTSTFTAAPKDAAGAAVTGQTISWSTSDASVATVSGGVVTAVKPGTANLIASIGSVQGTAAVTVIPAVASVAVTPNPVSIIIGQTSQLTATLKDAGGATITDRTVAWTSSNDLIASVSTTGLVTSKSVGSATITATVEGRTGSSVVTITPPPVATVSVNPPTSSLLVGATGTLSASAKDANGIGLTGRTFTWTSSDENVATVVGSNESAVVTAKAVGSATITATSEGKSGTSAVTVTVASVQGVSISPTTVSVAPGATAQLTATVTDGTGHVLTGRTVTWTTSDAGKVTVSANAGTQTATVTGVAYGSATITATSEGKSGTSTVKVTDVTPPVLAGLTFTPSTVDVTGGTKTVAVSAHVTDAGGSGASQIAVVATAPHGAFANCAANALSSGTASDGIWNCSITIPFGAEPGDWGVLVLVSDGAQNVSTYTATELAAGGMPTKFAVVSNWDQTPPGFTSLSVAPGTVDVSASAQTITVTAQLTDNASGVARFDFSAKSPNGTTVGCSAVAPLTGNNLNGSWSCTVTIPAQADPGAWAITVKATDRAFFSQTYGGSIAFPAGFPTTFTVTR